MLGADLLCQIAGRRDELMLLERLLGLVGLQVGLAEGAHTHQAALQGNTPLPLAHVAQNGCGGQLGFRGQPASASDRIPHLWFTGPFAELLHSLGQHGVSGQGGLGTEGLTTLGAAVNAFGVILGPEVLNAGHAVAVSTGYSDRIIWEIQTHGTVKLLLRPQLPTHCDAAKHSGWQKKRDQRCLAEFSPDSKQQNGGEQSRYEGRSCAVWILKRKMSQVRESKKKRWVGPNSPGRSSWGNRCWQKTVESMAVKGVSVWSLSCSCDGGLQVSFLLTGMKIQIIEICLGRVKRNMGWKKNIVLGSSNSKSLNTDELL